MRHRWPLGSGTRSTSLLAEVRMETAGCGQQRSIGMATDGSLSTAISCLRIASHSSSRLVDGPIRKPSTIAIIPRAFGLTIYSREIRRTTCSTLAVREDGQLSMEKITRIVAKPNAHMGIPTQETTLFCAEMGGLAFVGNVKILMRGRDMPRALAERGSVPYEPFVKIPAR